MNSIIIFNKKKSDLDKKQNNLINEINKSNNDYEEEMNTFLNNKETKLIKLNNEIIEIKNKGSNYFDKIRLLRKNYDDELNLMNKNLINKKKLINDKINQLNFFKIMYQNIDVEIKKILKNIEDNKLNEFNNKSEDKKINKEIFLLESEIDIKYIEIKNVSEISQKIEKNIKNQNKTLKKLIDDININTHKSFDNLYIVEIEDLMIKLKELNDEKNEINHNILNLKKQKDSNLEKLLIEKKSLKRKELEHNEFINNLQNKKLEIKIDKEKKNVLNSKFKRENINNNLSIKELIEVQNFEKKISELNKELNE
jgi:hypothetical protein